MHSESCSTVDDTQKKAIATEKAKQVKAQTAAAMCDVCEVLEAKLKCICDQRKFCSERCMDLDHKNHRWSCPMVPEEERSERVRAAVERHEVRSQTCNRCQQAAAVQSCSCMQRTYCGEACMRADWKLHRWECAIESGMPRSPLARKVVEQHEARARPRFCARCPTKKATVSCPCTQRAFCDDNCFAIDWKDHRWVCPTVPEKEKWANLRKGVEDRERKAQSQPQVSNAIPSASVPAIDHGRDTRASGTQEIPGVIEKRHPDKKVYKNDREPDRVRERGRNDSMQNGREKDGQGNKRLRTEPDSSNEGPSRKSHRDGNSRNRARESRESSRSRQPSRPREEGRDRELEREKVGEQHRDKDSGRNVLSDRRPSERDRLTRVSVDRIREDHRGKGFTRDDRDRYVRNREGRWSKDRESKDQDRDGQRDRERDRGNSQEVRRSRERDRDRPPSRDGHNETLKDGKGNGKTREDGKSNRFSEVRDVDKSRAERNSRDEIKPSGTRSNHNHKGNQGSGMHLIDKTTKGHKKMKDVVEGVESLALKPKKPVDKTSSALSASHRQASPTKKADVTHEKPPLMRKWTEDSIPIPKKSEPFTIRVPKKGTARIAHVAEVPATVENPTISPVKKDIHRPQHPVQKGLAQRMSHGYGPTTGGNPTSDSAKHLRKEPARSPIKKQTSAPGVISSVGPAALSPKKVARQSSAEPAMQKVHKTSSTADGTKQPLVDLHPVPKKKRKLVRGSQGLRKKSKKQKRSIMATRPIRRSSESSTCNSGSSSEAQHTDGNTDTSDSESELKSTSATDLGQRDNRYVCTKCNEPEDPHGIDGMEHLFKCATPGCFKAGHGSCYEYSPVLVDNLIQSKRPWLCYVCKTCTKCKSTEEQDMLLCDYCDSGTHKACCDPPVTRELEENEDWLCKLCSLYGEGAGIGLKPIPGFTSENANSVPKPDGARAHTQGEGNTAIGNGMRMQSGLTNSPFAIMKPNSAVTPGESK